MTAEELAALPPDALIYLPTGWDVTVWRPGGAVENSGWYTLLAGPDADGVVRNRKPYYIELVDLLLRGSADEATAWLFNVEQLQERINWIQQHKLNEHANHQPR